MDNTNFVYNVLYYVQIVTLYTPQPFVFLIIIFLINEFRLPTSPLQNPFYVFIFLFTIYYNFVALGWAINYTGFVPFEMKRVYNLLILRYYTLVVGIWNTGVCLNRVTAIAMPFKHGMVWSRAMTTVFAVLFFVYPLAFQTPFMQNRCWKSVSTSECMAFHNLNMYIIAMSVIGHAVLGVLLITMALVYARYRGWLAARSAERKLILQTLVTSLLLICVGTTKMLAMQNYFYGNFVRHQILSSIGTILLALYTCVVIGGLFFASSSFRQKFIEFYRCKSCSSKVRAMYGSTIEVDQIPAKKRPSL
uniref:Serpentine receptor class gamma n=1 Tax=Panagrellus redivivus TaxID=6233 RepID=A0A7E4W6E5_PANRE